MARLMKKARKPRGIKLNGQEALDMCTCFAFHCDPMTMSRKFSEKISKRLRNGQCGSCGSPKDNCKCKSSMQILEDTPINVIRWRRNHRYKISDIQARKKEHLKQIKKAIAVRKDVKRKHQPFIQPMEHDLYRF